MKQKCLGILLLCLCLALPMALFSCGDREQRYVFARLEVENSDGSLHEAKSGDSFTMADGTTLTLSEETMVLILRGDGELTDEERADENFYNATLIYETDRRAIYECQWEKQQSSVIMLSGNGGVIYLHIGYTTQGKQLSFSSAGVTVYLTPAD